MDTITIKEHNKNRITEKESRGFFVTIICNKTICNKTICNKTICYKTINIQQNIIINSYGKENLNYLTTKYLTGLIHRPFDLVQSLLRTIHLIQRIIQRIIHIRIFLFDIRMCIIRGTGNLRIKKML